MCVPVTRNFSHVFSDFFAFQAHTHPALLSPAFVTAQRERALEEEEEEEEEGEEERKVHTHREGRASDISSSSAFWKVGRCNE